MSHSRSENPDCKIYVGDLSTHASKQDVEDAFSYYGPIKNVWVARNPPGFAFVEFDDTRDAEDAVKEVDGGRTVCGKRVRVERAGDRHGGGRGFRRPFRRRGSRGRSFHPEERCYECGIRGHFARECRRGRRSRGRAVRSYSRSRSRSDSRDRSRYHSRNSRSRVDHSRSESTSRSRSRSRSKNNRSRSRSNPRHNDHNSRDKKSISKSYSKSRSRSPDKNKDDQLVNGNTSG